VQENKPLIGKNVLVTREHSQAALLSGSLDAKGARSFVCPVIAFSPPADWGPADRCLERLSAYDGLLFTSANAVEFAFKRMEEKGIPPEGARRLTAYAVGPATAEALASRGVRVKRLPDSFQAEGLASLLESEVLRGKAFLFPRAKKAREWLPRFLEEKGARVDVAVVYETRSAVENRDLLRKILATGQLDYLTFTSGSTVRAFVEMAECGSGSEAWRAIPAACIGELTAERARKDGFHLILTARPSTITALVQAIVDHATSALTDPGSDRRDPHVDSDRQ
jgi:uroporphyrinogen III methyltransferase/synthase